MGYNAFVGVKYIASIIQFEHFYRGFPLWKHLFQCLPELGRLLHIFTDQISIIMFFDFLISKVTLFLSNLYSAYRNIFSSPVLVFWALFFNLLRVRMSFLRSGFSQGKLKPLFLFSSKGAALFTNSIKKELNMLTWSSTSSTSCKISQGCFQRQSGKFCWV